MTLLNRLIAFKEYFHNISIFKASDKFSLKAVQSMRYLTYLEARSIKVNTFLKQSSYFCKSFLVGALLVLLGYPYFTPTYLSRFNTIDVTQEYLKFSSNKKSRGSLAKDRVLEDLLQAQKVDDISLGQIGLFCSEDAKPELAFHCYEILHLRHPSKFKTNSELAIETNAQPGKAAGSSLGEGVTINDVLESVS